MPITQTQTFAFAPPQQGVSQVAQAGVIANVPLDGSATVTVPYAQPYVQYVQSVVASYTPATETDYQVTYSILPIAPATSLNASLSGFVISATGGPAGTTGNFTYQAVGL